MVSDTRKARVFRAAPHQEHTSTLRPSLPQFCVRNVKFLLLHDKINL